MNPSTLLGLFYFASELLLRFTRQTKRAAANPMDRSTLRLLWITILGSIASAVLVARFGPVGKYGLSPRALWGCEAIFWTGIILRWAAILTLGKFFTVDVTIQTDHRLVKSGLYRWVRHPSYPGMMLAFLGYSLTLRNAGSVALIIVPISLALARRISVEEEALRGAFGEDYRRYQQETKRLVPGLF